MLELNKVDNWQMKLSCFLNESRSKYFDFPNWNCLTFAADAIECLTNFDLLAKYRSKYKTEKEAAKLLRKLDNVKTSQELFKKHFGEIKPVAFARIGDIVFCDDSSLVDLPTDTRLFGPVPGVCYGNVSFFVGESGLISVDTLHLSGAIWVS